MTSISKTETTSVLGDKPVQRKPEKGEAERPEAQEKAHAAANGQPVISDVGPRIESYEKAHDLARSLQFEIPRNGAQALHAQANQSESIVQALMS